MTGIENLLTGLIGEDRTLLMLAGFVLLILMNLVAKLIVEYKKKNLHWNDLPEFIKPIMLYGAFLIGLDVMVMVSRDIELVSMLFIGLQSLGFGAVMIKYFKIFYDNLMELGMPIDEKMDEAIQGKLGSVSEETKEELHRVIDEYIVEKEVE